MMTNGTAVKVYLAGTENRELVDGRYIEDVYNGCRVEVTQTVRMRFRRHIIAGDVVTVGRDFVAEATEVGLF